MRDPIPLSPLGFGCAPVMGKVSKTHALRAMAQAFDLGVTHFDVARSYGFGRAEGVVGAFIKGRRDQVTVTTKFGVVAPELSLKTRLLIPVARQVSQFLPHLKARLKSKSGQMLAERNFDVSYARKCLDRSLQELGTDYIDIYLIHEPQTSALSNPDELRQLMEDSIRIGKIRRWGYALQMPGDYAWTQALGGDITQFEGNVSTLHAMGPLLRCAMQRMVTRPFMGGGANAELHSLLQRLELLEIVRGVGASLADVSLCIGRALGGQTGAVLCSMFSVDHIQTNVQSLGKFEHVPEMTRVVSAVIGACTAEAAAI